MLSVKSDRPVDPLTLAVLRAIAGITRELGLPYFVAGAMARDIVLTNVFGIDTGRATQDVDLAVAVENWDQFKIVKEKLIASGQFNPAEKAMHRLYYRAKGGNTGYPLDILPFRGVEQPPSIIAWPPDMKVIMNVIGYEDALAAAVALEQAIALRKDSARRDRLITHMAIELRSADDRIAEAEKLLEQFEIGLAV